MGWTASAGVHNGGHKMGPIVPHFGLHFDTTSESAHEVEGHANFVYEKDVSVAGRALVNVGDRKVSEA